MCLYIKKDQEENERDLKRWFGQRQKFAYVYKILMKEEEESFYRSHYYNNFIWDFSKEKVFEVYRDPKPTVFELNRKEINYGLHVYTSLKRTIWDYICSNSKIVKFKALKEDIIAVNQSKKEAVCKKLTFVKVVK